MKYIIKIKEALEKEYIVDFNKTKLKRLMSVSFIVLMFLVSFFIPKKTESQMVVTDPVTQAHLAAQATTLASQTTAMMQQAKTLFEMKQKFEQVNGAIQSATLIKRIIMNQQKSISQANKTVEMMKESKMFNGDEILHLSKQTNALIENQKQSIELVLDVLSDGAFKMNDAERLQVYHQAIDKVEEAQKNMNQKSQVVEQILTKRTMKYIFGSTY